MVHKWWVNIVLALLFSLFAYGFASWAINSGSLLEYGFTIFFLGWAINRLIRGIQYAISR